MSKYPSDWRKTNLGALGDCLIGLTYSPEDIVKTGGTIVLRSSNVQNGQLDFKDCVRVRTPIPERIRMRENDILVCVRNGSRDLIGKSALITKSVSGETAGAFMAIFRSPNARFVFQLLQTTRFKKQVDANLGATINQITNKQFNDLTFWIPPLPEQRKVADILTTWDQFLTRLDALIEAQERRKIALMQQLLAGKQRFPAFAKKPWKKVRMGEVLKRVFRRIDWSAEMSLSLVSLRRRCGGLFRRPDVLGADYKTQDLHELHADDFLIAVSKSRTSLRQSITCVSLVTTGSLPMRFLFRINPQLQGANPTSLSSRAPHSGTS